MMNRGLSEELMEKAMTSDEAAAHAKFNAGLFGYTPAFWQFVQSGIKEGFMLLQGSMEW